MFHFIIYQLLMRDILFVSQCRPTEGGDREGMRGGSSAAGAADERRRESGTECARVLLLGRNRHESDLSVQQERH